MHRGLYAASISYSNLVWFAATQSVFSIWWFGTENAWNKGICLVIAQKNCIPVNFVDRTVSMLLIFSFFIHKLIRSWPNFLGFTKGVMIEGQFTFYWKKNNHKCWHKARKHLYFFQELINNISMCSTDASDLQQLIRYHAVPAMGPGGGGVVNPQSLANGIAKIKSGKLKYGFWNDFCAKWHCRNSGNLNYYKKWRRIITAFICS